MSCVKSVLIALILLPLLACKPLSDDLTPSGEDKRPQVQAGSIGTEVGQEAPDFTALDSLGNSHQLSTELGGSRGVVLYFTMWCPICDSHMSHLRSQIMPDFSDVTFLMVDYVTGSVTASRSAQVSNGYANLTVLADQYQELMETFKGGMGITVVIGADGIVRMNEDYKDGSKLRQVLAELP